MLDESELENYTQNIPVDCHLNLAGLLFNPEVKFNLSFPTQNTLGSSSSTSTLTTVLERIKTDQEELNRQVFALLVLGTFIPPSFASGVPSTDIHAAQQAGFNSLSDFVSSQINNWLSHLDTKWQLGIDFQSLDTSLQKEFIVSLRRSFINDRLEFAASIDAAASQGSRPYDISLIYNLSKDGSFKVRGFQKNATDPYLGNLNNVTTTGVGLFYRYQFDKFFNREKNKAK